jgi:DNA-binding transcriptional MocR family regulator
VSVHALSWVLRHSETEWGARLVLIVLADHAGEQGENSYPSVSTIAQQARLSTRQVHRCLRQLEAEGHVERVGKSQWGTVRYRVVMSSPNRGSDSTSSPEQAMTNRAPEVSQMSPNPSLNPTTELPTDRPTEVGGGTTPDGPSAGIFDSVLKDLERRAA